MANPRDVDWNDLRHFLAAAKAGTLAGAARALGVDHSTIARRLAALEEALGAALATRGPDGLALTSVGARLLPLVEDIERTVAAAIELAATEKTHVRLAAPSGFGRILSPRLSALQAKHPSVTVELITGSRMVDLKKGEADVAIRNGASQDEDLVAKRIGDAAWSLYASAEYLARRSAPAESRDLSGHDLLGFDTALANVPGAKWIAAHGAGANVVMRCREMSDILAACAAGLGVAVIPVTAAALEPSLQRISSEVLGTSPLFVVYRKELLASEPVRAVVDFAFDVMREYLTVAG